MTGIAARSTMKSFAMKTSGNRAAHVKSTVLVAVALTVAILLAVSLLIATGTRGEGAARPPAIPAHQAAPASAARD
jgi:hypothetical protein